MDKVVRMCLKGGRLVSRGVYSPPRPAFYLWMSFVSQFAHSTVATAEKAMAARAFVFHTKKATDLPFQTIATFSIPSSSFSSTVVSSRFWVLMW
jgi:hypothetical protein